MHNELEELRPIDALIYQPLCEIIQVKQFASKAQIFDLHFLNWEHLIVVGTHKLDGPEQKHPREERISALCFLVSVIRLPP